MAMIDMKVNFDPLIEGVGLLQEQLPFAIARTLTLCAQDGQSAGRELERGVFTLRNDWVRSNTKITPATRQTLMAEVYTDTGNRKTGAPDFLPRQQEGGEKVPVSGHKFLAIPTRYLFKYTPKNRPIPDNLRPRAILPPDAQIGERYQGQFSAGKRAEGVKRVIAGRTLKKLRSGDFSAFTQFTRSGKLCIFVKHGGLNGNGGGRDAEPWYILVKDAHIHAIFPLEEVVVRVVNANVERNWQKAAAETIAGDALRGSGITVKF
jgi:hypothetical protein